MSKAKQFSQAPKPRPLAEAEIRAFVQSGPGHDVVTADEPKKRLSIDLPMSLHTRFKTACSASNRKMLAEVEAFVEKRTGELEASLRRD